MRHVAAAQDVDIVHSQQGEGTALLMLSARRAAVTPRLVTFHVSYRGIARAHRPYTIDGVTHGRDSAAYVRRWLTAPAHRILDWMARRSAEEVSFISRSARDDVLGAGARNPVIYNGVPTPEAAGGSASHAAILFVGTPGHRKRTMMLPPVLQRVRRSIPDATLRIVGFHLDDEAQLKADLQARGLLHAVDSVGPVGADDLGRFYAASAVLLVPSAYEGLPMVIIEAARHGLPTVATAVSGHPEAITDGVDGVLVPVDDPDHMARSVVGLLTDDRRRRLMGDAARQTAVERFGVDRQVDEYLSLYQAMRAASS